MRGQLDGFGSARNDGQGGSDSAEPLISVVVACFNDAANLLVAAGSALGQSLTDLEVIICDDCSTDDTRNVVAEMCAVDSRVRYERLPENSGSGAGPRNAGLRLARAPWVIFLDSDDELAPDALQLLLSAARDAGADVAAGRISRFYVADDRWSGWCTRLFEEPRTTQSIRAEPDRLYDTAAVGKLYNVSFLRRTGLEFVPGLLYEDCLWTAQVYATVGILAVIPDLVYVWKVHESASRRSVTNDRQSLRNVRGRLQANVAIDAWLASHGHSDLLPAKHEKFLRHDLALYMSDLISENDTWARQVIEEFRQYVVDIPREAIAELPVLHRIGVQMLDRRSLEGVRSVYRAITRGEFATDLIRKEGRVLWSAGLVDSDPSRAPDLDVSELRIDRRPFLQRRLAHDLHGWRAVAGGGIEVVIRTWNPMAAFDVNEARVWLELTPRGPRGFTEVFSGRVSALGKSWFESSYVLDPRPIERAPGDDLLTLAVVVQVGGLDNTGSIPAPSASQSLRENSSNSTPELSPTSGWVAPIRAMDGTCAVRHLAAPLAGEADQASSRRHWSAAWGMERVRTPAGRVGDAARKRVRRSAGPPLAVFCSDDGRGYSGNPKYLHQELVRSGWLGEAIWVRGRGGRGFPDGVETVQKGSRAYYLAMGSATHWVDDTDVPAHIGKPRGTIYLQACDALQARVRWAASPDGLGNEATHPGRWDFTLTGPVYPDESPSRHRPAQTRLLAGLGTPRLDPLARDAQRGKGPDALRSAGLPPNGGGLDVLLAPLTDRGQAVAGLPLRPEIASDLISDLGRLLFAARPADRWRMPDDVSHVLVDVGRVPDWTLAILASDVLVTPDLRLAREYLLLDRPVILLRHQGASGAAGPIDPAPGPVAQSSQEATRLLSGMAGWTGQYAGTRRALRARWLPAEDGRASSRIVRAVFGEWS